MPAKKTVEQEEEKKAPLLTQNMRFYTRVMNTPKEAQKEIGAGRLKGFTDINAMWRIQKLTELFGPVGIGWWTQNETYTLVPNEKTGEVACFCQLELVYVDPETGTPSHPITGVGGNKFITIERSGPYTNDEAYKMSYTDALSIACKALGFSHDIYFSKDRTKYTFDAETAQNQGAAKAEPQDVQDLLKNIQTGIQLLTKSATAEEKNALMNKVIVPIIGDSNYVACKDEKKLQELLAKLRELFAQKKS